MTRPFDDARFRGLLEGLEVSVVKFSEVLAGAETLRFDSEYYLKKYLRIVDKVRERAFDFGTFDDLKLEVDGSAFYPALEPYYGQGNFPFIRVGDVKATVDFENCIKIPKSVLADYPTLKEVFPGDIVLTKGGTVGLAGLITKHSCASRDLIFINSSKLKKEDYISLFLYLTSDFSYKQLIRSSSQSVQPHLTITLVRNLALLKFSEAFKLALTKIYEDSISNFNQAQSLYRQAEQTLLKTLGLSDLSGLAGSGRVVSAAKSFRESFGTSGRLDAEFYQPKYIQIEQRLRETGFSVMPFGNTILSVNNGLEIRDYVESGGTRYLRVTDLGKEEINDNSPRYIEKTVPPTRLRLNENCLLISRSGSLGLVNIVTEDILDAVLSSHIFRIELDPEQVTPIFLETYFRSAIGQELLLRQNNGGVVPEINHDGLRSVPIPLPKPEKIQQVSETLMGIRTEARRQKDLSRHLLATAKRAVEMAIEESETAAINWLTKTTQQ